MARGQQKIQSQQKAAEKAAKLKKQAGNSAAEQKKAAMAGLKMSCFVCKSMMPDPKTYKQVKRSREVPGRIRSVKGIENCTRWRSKGGDLNYIALIILLPVAFREQTSQKSTSS